MTRTLLKITNNPYELSATMNGLYELCTYYSSLQTQLLKANTVYLSLLIQHQNMSSSSTYIIFSIFVLNCVFFPSNSYFVFLEDTPSAQHKFMKFSSDRSFINVLFLFLWIFFYLLCGDWKHTENVLRAVEHRKMPKILSKITVYMNTGTETDKRVFSSLCIY